MEAEIEAEAIEIGMVSGSVHPFHGNSTLHSFDRRLVWCGLACRYMLQIAIYRVL